MNRPHILLLVIIFLWGCTSSNDTSDMSEKDQYLVQLINLDPGHFHASLVQKSMYEDISPTVFVYAPDGPEVDNYISAIQNFNQRAESPTSWIEDIYKGPDFLDKMIQEKKGNVVIISGNNERKTEYIYESILAGINVLADKPMVITGDDFERLQLAFELADEKSVLLYDIMTERYEITNMLQQELATFPELFGELQQGTPDDPAVVIESVHHFFKYVAGQPIKRPPWFFDVSQQGESIVDVATHLVDLAQWGCFPEEIIDFQKDIEVYDAHHWPTSLTREQFTRVTQLPDFPDFLVSEMGESETLEVLANGEFSYKLKDIHVKIIAKWDYEAPEGGGDTHYAIMKGSNANLVIRQGKEQNYKPALFVEPANGSVDLASIIPSILEKLGEKYPGLDFQKAETGWEIIIPESYRNGHEAHFAQVTNAYLQYLKDGKLPAWEIPNMLAKYYTTTQALELAKN